MTVPHDPPYHAAIFPEVVAWASTSPGASGSGAVGLLPAHSREESFDPQPRADHELSLSAGDAAAPVLGGHVRSRWGIENKVHRVRDVVFAEDAQHAYLGATAQAMAVFRNLVIGLIRLSGPGQITRTADRSRILPLPAASRP